MNKSYYNLLFEYVNSETDELSFSKWLENHNYRFGVNGKIFKDFDKMFDYLIKINHESKVNNGFDIIDSNGNIVAREENV